MTDYEILANTTKYCLKMSVQILRIYTEILPAIVSDNLWYFGGRLLGYKCLQNEIPLAGCK